MIQKIRVIELPTPVGWILHPEAGFFTWSGGGTAEDWANDVGGRVVNLRTFYTEEPLIQYHIPIGADGVRLTSIPDPEAFCGGESYCEAFSRPPSISASVAVRRNADDVEAERRVNARVPWQLMYFVDA